VIVVVVEAVPFFCFGGRSMGFFIKAKVEMGMTMDH